MKRCICVACLLLCSGLPLFPVLPSPVYAAGAAAQGMTSGNIAVAASGDTAESLISAVAGRAPYFLIFDRNGVLRKSVKNPGLLHERNSSEAVIGLILKESCKTVIAGRFGVKMQTKLNENGIGSYELEGAAGEAVLTLVKKRLKE